MWTEAQQTLGLFFNYESCKVTLVENVNAKLEESVITLLYSVYSISKLLCMTFTTSQKDNPVLGSELLCPYQSLAW